MNRTKIVFCFFALFVLTRCTDNTAEKFNPEFLIKYKLNFPEPSDLALDYEGTALWTVSDSNSKVYIISFDGRILKSFVVDGNDLESITQIDKNRLAVILERERTVLIIDTNGTELNRIKLDKEGDPNLGFEGITLNQNNNHLYIINEKNPGLLIELDVVYNIIKEIELKFANEYSGINYDFEKNEFWIISDENSLLAECDINGNLITSFNFSLIQIEVLLLIKEIN